VQVLSACRPVLLACALIAWTVGCEQTGRVGERGELRGVVVVLLDTVRADHLAMYGHGRETSPAMNELAARGVVFEQAMSYAPWTLPSVAAFLSSRWGNQVFPDDRLQESIVESFQQSGFRTAAITEGGFVSRYFGFDLGFSEYFEEEGEVQLILPGKGRVASPSGGIEGTFRHAIGWLEDLGNERFFLLVHTYEPHTPYMRRTFVGDRQEEAVGFTFGFERLPLLQNGSLRLDQTELDYLSALYDGGLLETDRHVGKLLDALDQLGLRDETLIVVTSDHGEELGGHHPSHCGDHGHSLHQNQLRVPLIVANPAERYPITRVPAQVRTIDILPTVADLLGVQAPPTDGHSLVPLMRGEETAGRIAYGGGTKVGPERAFVSYIGFKYVEIVGPANGHLSPPPPRMQLYDLTRDPDETTNLATARPETTRHFAQWLSTLRASASTAVNPSLEGLPDQLHDRLRSLGYVE
jgi:arylsulfatase A-like enzyme